MSVLAPETLDGWAMLHQFFRVDWHALKANGKHKEIVDEFSAWLDAEAKKDAGHLGACAIVGHKADFMLLHLRPSFEDLYAGETALAKLAISQYLRTTTSYVSFVELGMYDYTIKLEAKLLEQGLKENSEEWNKAWKEAMDDQADRVKGRTFCEIPDKKYYCFYPMNKLRNDGNNWYTVEMKKRGSMMREHGMIGRKYAGKVNQIISGSIGYDDWEWGVDLYADDPLTFKKLIYEMRFDEASAKYAEFGPFYTGYKIDTAGLLALFT